VGHLRRLTFKTYTSLLRWILFAITWAISKYHNSKLVDKAMSTYLAVKGAAMSNIDKQALREEFQYMQEHYSDPADRSASYLHCS
jgi:hypothetical protein